MTKSCSQALQHFFFQHHPPAGKHYLHPQFYQEKTTLIIWLLVSFPPFPLRLRTLKRTRGRDYALHESIHFIYVKFRLQGKAPLGPIKKYTHSKNSSQRKTESKMFNAIQRRSTFNFQTFYFLHSAFSPRGALLRGLA